MPGRTLRTVTLPLVLLATVIAGTMMAAWQSGSEGLLALLSALSAAGVALMVHRILNRQRHHLAESRRHAEIAHGRLEDAIESSNEGFALFDAQDRLVVANRRFSQVCEAAQPGARFVDIVTGAVFSGVFHESIGDRKAFLRDRLERHANPPSTCEVRTADDRWLQIAEHRTRDGGTVVFVTDVTALKQRDLAEQEREVARQAEETLRKSEEHLQAILEASPIGVAVSAPRGGQILFANSRFAELNGVPQHKLLGRTVAEFYAKPEEREALDARLWAEGIVHDEEIRLKRPDGSSYWALLTLRLTSFGGEPAVLAWVYDITERKKAEAELKLASLVLDTANEAIMIFDADNIIRYVNPAFTGYTGHTAADAVGSKPGFLKAGRHDKDFYRRIRETLAKEGRWQGEMWNRHKSGKFIAAWVSLAAIRDEDGAMTHLVSVSQDITTRKEDEERIWRQANFDVLTGLPNRALFMDRLDQAVKQGNRERQLFALMFLDLDGFKAVNDSLGHAAGDLLLQETARRIEGCVRSTDTVSRLAGDEFTVILMDIKAPDHAARIARNILKVLSEPFDLEGRQAQVRASIGVTLYPRDGEDAETLLRNADATMYVVKRSGKNSFRFFETEEASGFVDA